MNKLLDVKGLRKLLPFARTVYAQPSCYHLEEEEEGERHHIGPREGGEQGDPLMLLLFCLAVHNHLAEVEGLMRPRRPSSVGASPERHVILSRPLTFGHGFGISSMDG